MLQLETRLDALLSPQFQSEVDTLLTAVSSFDPELCCEEDAVLTLAQLELLRETVEILQHDELGQLNHQEIDSLCVILETTFDIEMFGRPYDKKDETVTQKVRRMGNAILAQIDKYVEQIVNAVNRWVLKRSMGVAKSRKVLDDLVDLYNLAFNSGTGTAINNKLKLESMKFELNDKRLAPYQDDPINGSTQIVPVEEVIATIREMMTNLTLAAPRKDTINWLSQVPKLAEKTDPKDAVRAFSDRLQKTLGDYINTKPLKEIDVLSVRTTIGRDGLQVIVTDSKRSIVPYGTKAAELAEPGRLNFWSPDDTMSVITELRVVLSGLETVIKNNFKYKGDELRETVKAVVGELKRTESNSKAFASIIPDSAGIVKETEKLLFNRMIAYTDRTIYFISKVLSKVAAE